MIKLELSPEQFKRLTGVQVEKLADKYPDLYEDGELKEDADIFDAVLNLTKMKVKEHGDKQWKASRQALEKHLKAAGIEDFEKAEEGLELLIERLNGDRGKDPAAKLTDEEVMKHPSFQAAVESKVQVLKQKLETTEAEYNTFRTAVESEKKNTGRRAAIAKELKALNANFGTKGEDAAIAAFLALHPNVNVNDTGALVNEKGEPIQDNEYNTQTLADFLKSEWLFGLNAAPATDAPPPPQGKEAGKMGAYKITSPQQYNEMIQRPGLTSSEKSEIRQAYAEFLEAK